MRHQDCSLIRSLSPVVRGQGRVVGAMREGQCLAADQVSPEVGNGCRRRTLPVQKWYDKDTHMWCWR